MSDERRDRTVHRLVPVSRTGSPPAPSRPEPGDDGTDPGTGPGPDGASGDGADTAGWLLPSEDAPKDPGGAAAPDAVTEALPHGRGPRRASTRRRRARRWVWPSIAAVLVLALVGGVFVAGDLVGLLVPPDYDGPGHGSAIVRVTEGDTTRAIGEELARQDVVASARAFGAAAEDHPDGRGIQPGYYQLRRQMSASGAVTALLDPASRLGRFEVRSGTQLDDTAGPGSTTVPGVLELISRATCLPAGPGAERCAGAGAVREVMATTDPAELGVPGWALDAVRRADPARRLEGLIAPGTYDLPPGADPREALERVIRTSTERLEAGGLVRRSKASGTTPYETLIVASLVEKEGVPQDFGKVARVVYNRLAVPMPLQFDSTINYPLDQQRLLTTPADRARPGPYNTYLNPGLPPTPIAAVSPAAIRAALEPTPGPWMYFVRCQVDGESCFAVTRAEHDANRRLAQQRGAY